MTHTSHGYVLLGGWDIIDLSQDELAPLRNATLGFMFQAYQPGAVFDRPGKRYVSSRAET